VARRSVVLLANQGTLPLAPGQRIAVVGPRSHEASAADVCVAVLGDRSGLFGRGTSGEGCDAADLRLPGRQEELLEALLAAGTPVVLVLLAAGTPVVLVLLAGRPDELSARPAGWPPRCAGSTPARRARPRWPTS